MQVYITRQSIRWWSCPVISSIDSGIESPHDLMKPMEQFWYTISKDGRPGLSSATISDSSIGPFLRFHSSSH